MHDEITSTRWHVLVSQLRPNHMTRSHLDAAPRQPGTNFGASPKQSVLWMQPGAFGHSLVTLSQPETHSQNLCMDLSLSLSLSLSLQSKCHAPDSDMRYARYALA
jgi:hypothetical protein